MVFAIILIIFVFVLELPYSLWPFEALGTRLRFVKGLTVQVVPIPNCYNSDRRKRTFDKNMFYVIRFIYLRGVRVNLGIAQRLVKCRALSKLWRLIVHVKRFELIIRKLSLCTESISYQNRIVFIRYSLI